MRRSLLVIAVSVAACGGGSTPPAPDAPPQFNGGSITVPGCGYAVTTPVGAEAPAAGTPVFGSDPTPRLIHLSLATDPTTSMVVSWRTMDETTEATTIKFGEGTALDQTAEGITFAYQDGFNSKDLAREHEVHLCGLKPDTQYSYQVGGTDGSGAAHFSPTYTFRTAPDVGADPSAQVVIAIVGDCRGAYDEWGKIVTQVMSRAPDLILFTGDMVELGQVQANWDAYFEAAQPLFASVPMISAMGNHESDAVDYFTQLALPGDEQDFSLDYGHAHIVVLNDSPTDPADITGKAATFLSSDLASHTAATWKLVMHHRALYSSSTHGSQADVQAAWGPVYDQYAVDFVFNGHDHDYERSKPLKAGVAQTDGSGPVYVVQGGAGADLYPAGTSAFTAYSESAYGADVITAGPTMLSGTVFHDDGSPMDSFSKTKP